MLLDTLVYKQNAKVGSRGISLLKAISWRLIGTLDTVLIAYIITGEITAAVSIGGIEVFSKIALFYIHERAWKKIELRKK